MKIIQEKCKKCFACLDVCPVKAIEKKNEKVVINVDKCLECGCCASSCPNSAIEYE
ncbi:MAG: 4Fe-4S binding protein [Holosporaceae bacterium]|jgi:ferredoxin|nr:4Fe-4S binding protein [Holosporaceae bacterium]